MADEYGAAVRESRGNVVLVFEREGRLVRRIFVYGFSTWEAEDVLVFGSHPQLVDQSGLLWLVWEQSDVIFYATSMDGGRNFSSLGALPWTGVTPSVEVLPNGFVGVAFASAGGLRLSTEQDNFSTVRNIVAYSLQPDNIVFRSHGGRLFCGWIEDEEALLVFSDDGGFSWSSQISLGSATGLDIEGKVVSEHLLAVVEWDHKLYGLVSRDRGLTWDDRWHIYTPDASVDPAIHYNAYHDVIVFSSILDTSIPTQHEYRVQLTNAPFFGYISDVLDLGNIQLGEESWHTLPDWFYWGPRAWCKFDIRSGEASHPDASWTSWLEVLDAKETPTALRRYMQHRFYAVVPQDVRESRDRPILPEFIYRLFNLKWWGTRLRYSYYDIYNFYYYYGYHYWGFTQTITGWQIFESEDFGSVTTREMLPVFEVQ
jgi:hypothetical protein